MKTIKLRKVTTRLILMLALFSFTFSQAQETFEAVDNTENYSTIDLLYMDKNLSVFAGLLTLSGLDTSLAFTDSELTLLVPTNEAFANMSIDKFAKLTDPKNRSKLASYVKNHILSSRVYSSDLDSNDVVNLSNNKQININEANGVIYFGGATVSNANIETKNGLVHVLSDTVNIADGF